MDIKLLGELIEQVLYILPLCVLIYKVGKFATEHEQLKHQIDQMSQEYGIHISNEALRYHELLSKIGDVANAVTRIETKLEERTRKE